MFNLVPIPPLDGYGVADGLFRSHAPALFQWIDRNRTGILIAALLLFFVLPDFFNSGFSISGPIFDVAGWIWRAVVGGTMPQPFFPNYQYLVSAAPPGFATALANPCYG